MNQEQKRLAKLAAWRAARAVLAPTMPVKPKRSPLWSEKHKRAADRIDGYDRDDLGLSPDF